MQLRGSAVAASRVGRRPCCPPRPRRRAPRAARPAPTPARSARPAVRGADVRAGRLAPLATGDGVRVAVIDSGVDADHPQLRGRVAAGRDFLHGDPDGRQDCVGHGTGGGQHHRRAAGRRRRLPRAGARRARSCRSGSASRPRSTAAARGDRRPTPAGSPTRSTGRSTQGDADVINLSLVMTDDDSRVRDAVAAAPSPPAWWWSPRPATTASRRGATRRRTRPPTTG